MYNKYLANNIFENALHKQNSEDPSLNKDSGRLERNLQCTILNQRPAPCQVLSKPAKVQRAFDFKPVS